MVLNRVAMAASRLARVVAHSRAMVTRKKVAGMPLVDMIVPFGALEDSRFVVRSRPRCLRYRVRVLLGGCNVNRGRSPSRPLVSSGDRRIPHDGCGGACRRRQIERRT